MAMTSAESQWLPQVMRLIDYVAVMKRDTHSIWKDASENLLPNAKFPCTPPMSDD
jgi:hypothetical protein